MRGGAVVAALAAFALALAASSSGAAGDGAEAVAATAAPAAGIAACEDRQFGRRNVRLGPLEGRVLRPPYRGFHAALTRVSRYGHRRHGAFAGLYVQPARRVAHIGFARHHRRHRANVLELLPRPANVRFFRARYSIARLERLQQRIGRELMWTDDPALELGTRISGTDINYQRNVILVFAEEFTCGVRRKVRQRYGPRAVWVPPRDVVVRPGAPSPRLTQP